jgi:hypothetical protein
MVRLLSVSKAFRWLLNQLGVKQPRRFKNELSSDFTVTTLPHVQNRDDKTPGIQGIDHWSLHKLLAGYQAGDEKETQRERGFDGAVAAGRQRARRHVGCWPRSLGLDNAPRLEPADVGRSVIIPHDRIVGKNCLNSRLSLSYAISRHGIALPIAWQRTQDL